MGSVYGGVDIHKTRGREIDSVRIRNSTKSTSKAPHGGHKEQCTEKRHGIVG